jgi:DNA-binding NtrC family response regulator
MAFFKRSTPPSPTVFVVDDEVCVLDLAEAILTQEMGLKVQKFTDPEMALKAYETAHSRPSLVITDYAMGRMSGMDLIRECRRLNPRQKTLLISGTVDGEVFADAMIKPDVFMTKPYQVPDFVNKVHALLAV